MKIIDLVEALAPGHPTTEIGIRPGEKLHEEMVSADDSYRTVKQDDRYVVMPTIGEWGFVRTKGDPVSPGFSYRSDTNEQWLSPAELRATLNLD